jgi:hypothetical protein
MESLLLVITVISIGVAIASLTAAYREKRRERERSEARVVALAQAAETHGSPDGGWKMVSGEWQWTPEVGGSRNQAVEVNSERKSDVELGMNADRVATPSDTFFGTVQRDEPTTNRWPIFAAAVLLLALGGALVFLNSSASTDDGVAVVQAARSEPLELVALGHVRDPKLLTITGTVRNPTSGAKLEGLTAVISLLDRNGALVSTKDVPLDYRALGPGEEAPFKVAVPDPGQISRYRVSFRAGTDVVPHVDRRTDTKLASALQSR